MGLWDALCRNGSGGACRAPANAANAFSKAI